MLLLIGFSFYCSLLPVNIFSTSVIDIKAQIFKDKSHWTKDFASVPVFETRLNLIQTKPNDTMAPAEKKK